MVVTYDRWGQMLAHPWGGAEVLEMGWRGLWHSLNSVTQGTSWVGWYDEAHPGNPAHWVTTSTAVRVRWELRDEGRNGEHTITCHLHWVGSHSKHNLKVEEIWGRARDEAVLPSVITKFWQAGFKTQSFGGYFGFFFLKRFPLER